MVSYQSTVQHVQLDALGDGTRRAILARLLADGPLAVGDLAGTFRVTRPAISQHLRVLKDADLVRDERDGTRRVYELNPHGFQLVQQYFEQFWTQALLAFKLRVEADHRATPSGANRAPRTRKR